MNGSLGQDLGDLAALEARLHADLLGLRSTKGRLTVQKFSAFETLRLVCGGGDLLDAYLMFERELRRYEALGREEAAAALSISAPADTVLDRLQMTADALSTDEARDQRTARRWSDAGLKTMARELTCLADVQGRLGSELLTIELSGDRRDGLRLVISQLTTTGLDAKDPIVRLWRYDQGGNPTEAKDGLTIDLSTVPGNHADNEQHKLKRHHIHLELAEDVLTTKVDAEDPLYAISIESRDAPMRTVSFNDQSDLGTDLGIRFTTYRTIASIEIVRRRSGRSEHGLPPRHPGQA